MAYREDFANADGWSAADVSTRLNNAAGRKFLTFLQSRGVDIVIRYYASSARPKTVTPEEAKMLSRDGFGILPVFQDSSRNISDFSKASGTANAKSAIVFARRIGQPQDSGSTILFAVDADYTVAQIEGPILDYFQAVHDQIAGSFRIGAYGSGAVLSRLLAEQLIAVPWLSMSRLFRGTEPFFYSDRWSIRQVPPELIHEASGIGYDRNVVRAPLNELGAFRLDASGDDTAGRVGTRKHLSRRSVAEVARRRSSSNSRRQP